MLMAFGSRHMLYSIDPSFAVLFLGKDIKPQNTVTYLGVELDETLYVDNHVKSIKKKVSKTLGMLSHIRHLLPTQVRKQVYSALVLSHLNYCSSVWEITSKSNVNALVVLYNRICRNTLGVKRKTCDTQHLDDALNWPTLKNRLK